MVRNKIIVDGKVMIRVIVDLCDVGGQGWSHNQCWAKVKGGTTVWLMVGFRIAVGNLVMVVMVTVRSETADTVRSGTHEGCGSGALWSKVTVGVLVRSGVTAMNWGKALGGTGAGLGHCGRHRQGC